MKKILIIEDSRIMVEITSQWLKQKYHKYIIDAFNNYDNVIKAFETMSKRSINEIKVLLCDYRVYGNITFETFLDYLREKKINISIIVITAYKDDGIEKLKDKSKSIENIIYKPFKKEDFMQVIEKIIS